MGRKTRAACLLLKSRIATEKEVEVKYPKAEDERASDDERIVKRREKDAEKRYATIIQ